MRPHLQYDEHRNFYGFVYGNLHETVDNVLARGEKLDSLVEKSSDLSAASQENLRSLLHRWTGITPKLSWKWNHLGGHRISEEPRTREYR